MSKSGKLKRSNVISKNALNFGKKYAKNIDKCILLNEVLINQLEEINKQLDTISNRRNSINITIQIS